MTEQELLNERLATQVVVGDNRRENGAEAASPSPPISNRSQTDVDFSQWQVGANSRFRPSGRTAPQLPSACYRVGQDDYGPYLQSLQIISDHIVELPDTANDRVLNSIRKFWASKERYWRYGLVYKRGIFLWGPPGSGKTVTVGLLIKELIQKHNGIVLMIDTFADLWDRINGKKHPWGSNPFVWVIEFKRVSP